MHEIPRSPFPLVLGFSGHRDLPAEDESRLADRLRRIFTCFREAYPHTRLVWLSSLAEGADRLAVETALAEGVEVRIALPMPRQAFLASTSFASPEARQRSERLLNHPLVHSFAVPLPASESPADEAAWLRLAQARPELDPAGSTARHRAYAQGSAYIASHSHVLVTFWDGLGGRSAGTAEWVRFKLTGFPPPDCPLGEPLRHGGDVGPVIWVRTRRLAREPGGQVGETRLILPQPAPDAPFHWRSRDWSDVSLRESRGKRLWDRVRLSWGQSEPAGHPGGPSLEDHHSTALAARREWKELTEFRDTCQAVEKFNAEAASRESPDLPTDSWSKLKSLGIPDDGDLRRIAGLRDLAGELARAADATLIQRQFRVFVLLFLAVVFFHFYGHLPDHHHLPVAYEPAWLVAFLLAVLVAGGVVLYVWWERLDQRRLDYRALAEALRVRLFWAVAGINRSVADSYLGQSRGPMSWARRALQSVSPEPQFWGRRFAGLSPEARDSARRAVMRLWVEQQMAFFAGKFHEREQWTQQLRRMAFGFTAAGWLGAAVLLGQFVVNPPPVPSNAHGRGGEDQAHLTPPSSAVYPHHGLLVGSALLIVLGGFVNGWCEKQSHEELAHQYNRMHNVFSQGRTELEAALTAGDEVRARQVLEALGHEALVEHAQWLILRRARPFELHLG